MGEIEVDKLLLEQPMKMLNLKKEVWLQAAMDQFNWTMMNLRMGLAERTELQESGSGLRDLDQS